jgi:hypothetical protein
MTTTNNNTVGLTEFVVLVYNFFRKYIKILIVWILAGICFVFIEKNLKDDYFESEASIYTETTTPLITLDILSPLTTHVESKNYDALANALHISVAEAEQIKTLEFSNSKHFKTSNSPSSGNKDLGKLIICYAQVYDPEVLTKLNSGIEYYLGSSAFLSQNVERSKEQNASTISSFDSIMNASFSNQPMGNQIDAEALARGLSIIESARLKVKYEQKTRLVRPFYVNTKPANKRLLISSSIIVFSLIMGMFMALLREIHIVSKQHR